MGNGGGECEGLRVRVSEWEMEGVSVRGGG